MDSVSDAAIVQALRGGREEAVELLLARYQGPLLGYAFRLLGDRAAAEDVVQESFLRFLDHLNDLREPEKLRGFLYQIATRLCRDHQRRPARREQAIADPSPQSAQDDNPVERYYVAGILADLDPAHAEVIVLRFYEDMDLQTIATVLKLPVGTVKSRLHHGLRKLRRSVELDKVNVRKGAWCREQ